MRKYGAILLTMSIFGFCSISQALAPYEVIEEVEIPAIKEGGGVTSSQPMINQFSAPIATPPSVPASSPEVYGGKAAQLEDQVQALSDQLASILDKMERVEHQQEMTAKKLESTVQSLEALQKKLESAPKHHEPTKHKALPPKSLEPKEVAQEAATKHQDEEVIPEEAAESSPNEEYQKARALISTGKYDTAENALLAFIKKYPNHELTGPAKYWLGETYFVQKKYTKAAATFADGYKGAPKGIKAPDNLLKLAMSLKELDKLKEACATVKELLKQKTAPDAILRKGQNLKNQLPSCK